jgi:membrane associated rhomboid family serine protease
VAPGGAREDPLLLPIGLDETRVSRLPWVSITLLALNVAVWLALAIAGGGDGDADARLREVVAYWRERTYLELPEELERRTGLSAEELARFSGAALRDDRPPGAEGEQEELDALCEALFEAQDATTERRYALVPARGLLQPGWITGQFLHGGFGHLLGNMLFFFLVVGPFLEDVWGRPFFLGFYLLGGVLAGAAQAIPMGDSPIPILGASGAISACLGAFALRFAHRRVRMFYWFFLVVRGTFFVPAWAYAFLALGLDLLGLRLNGTGGGVAYAAHVGGFVFGLAVAIAVRATGLEKRICPEGALAWSGSLGSARAADALAGGRVSDARKLYEEVLARSPSDPEALLGLARIAAAALERATATGYVERLLALHVARGDLAAAAALVAELAPAIDPAHLRPQVAYRAAELAAPNDPLLADLLDERAAAAGGAVAAKALLRAAERVRGSDPALARARAERAAAAENVPPELAQRAAELVAALGAEPPSPAARASRFAAVELPPGAAEELVPRSDMQGFAPAPQGGSRPSLPSQPSASAATGPVELAARIAHTEPGREDREDSAPDADGRATPASTPAESDASPAGAAALAPEIPVRLVRCRLLGASDAGLDLALEGGKRAVLPSSRVAAIASGVVGAPADPQGARRNHLLLDLLLHPRSGERGRVVLRIPAQEMALRAVHPDVAPREAFGRVVEALLAASGAVAAPSAEAAAGRPFARFEDAVAFETAAWGRRVS